MSSQPISQEGLRGNTLINPEVYFVMGCRSLHPKMGWGGTVRRPAAEAGTQWV